MRNILIEWSPLDERRAGFFAVAFGLLLALLGFHAIVALVAHMSALGLQRRGSALWIAAMIHRLSGLALAIFLPIHFFVLGLSFHGGARAR